jgi:Holliday junction resolvase RusA-like endonuclease
MSELTLKFTLPFKPLPVNQSKGFRRGGFIGKSEKYREYEPICAAHFESQIKSQKSAVDYFFNKKFKKPIAILFKVHLPNLITKEGEYSKTRGDWDGFPKVTQDILFRCLNQNDAQILDGRVVLVPSDSEKTEIILF